MMTTQDAVRIANKAAEVSEREFIKGAGFGLTDDELTKLQRAIFVVFNESIMNERNKREQAA